MINKGISSDPVVPEQLHGGPITDRKKFASRCIKGRARASYPQGPVGAVAVAVQGVATATAAGHAPPVTHKGLSPTGG
jgi:hypothetical protein